MNGSEELLEEELDIHAQRKDFAVKEFEKAAADSAAARAFLNTALGQTIRKTISLNKLSRLEACASSEGEELAKAQFDYRVICEVANVFAVIITGGDEAINYLEAMRFE